jgi:hypothetical protein
VAEQKDNGVAEEEAAERSYVVLEYRTAEPAHAGTFDIRYLGNWTAVGPHVAMARAASANPADTTAERRLVAVAARNWVEELVPAPDQRTVYKIGTREVVV